MDETVLETPGLKKIKQLTTSHEDVANRALDDTCTRETVKPTELMEQEQFELDF